MTGTGGLLCWGDNGSGALGDGTTSDRPTPVGVASLATGVQDVAAAVGYSCVITSTGGVKCWGSNFFGQVGDGTTTERHTPVNVVGLPGKAAGIQGDVNCDGQWTGADIVTLISRIFQGVPLPC